MVLKKYASNLNMNYIILITRHLQVLFVRTNTYLPLKFAIVQLSRSDLHVDVASNYNIGNCTNTNCLQSQMLYVIPQ